MALYKNTPKETPIVEKKKENPETVAAAKAFLEKMKKK
jgi:hypothetical protein